MSTLDRSFEDIAYLAREVEESDNFDAALRSFLDAVREFRSYLYRFTRDPLIHEHLDYLGEFDLRPPEEPLLQRLLPGSQRQMYGKYQHRQKMREEVRKIAARFVVIRRLLA